MRLDIVATNSSRKSLRYRIIMPTDYQKNHDLTTITTTIALAGWTRFSPTLTIPQPTACTVALRSSLPQPTSAPRREVRVLLIAT